MKDENSVPAAQKMTDLSLPIFPFEVQKARIQRIDYIPGSPVESSCCSLCSQNNTIVVLRDSAWPPGLMLEFFRGSIAQCRVQPRQSGEQIYLLQERLILALRGKRG
jgi:hypothetical protein